MERDRKSDEILLPWDIYAMTLLFNVLLTSDHMPCCRNLCVSLEGTLVSPPPPCLPRPSFCEWRGIKENRGSGDGEGKCALKITQHIPPPPNIWRYISFNYSKCCPPPTDASKVCMTGSMFWQLAKIRGVQKRGSIVDMKPLYFLSFLKVTIDRLSLKKKK